MDRFRINEQSSYQITFTIKDQDLVVVPLSDISAATLTLYDIETYIPATSPAGVINDRDEQDVKNSNNVTIHATSGLVTWAVQPDDNPIVTPRRQIERHRAEFHLTFVAGDFWYRCEIEVQNMGRPA